MSELQHAKSLNTIAEEVMVARSSARKSMRDYEAQNLLLKLIQESPDFYIIGEMKSQRFFWVSPSFCQALGYDFDYLTKTKICDIVPEDDLVFNVRAFDWFIRQTNNATIPIRYITASGEILFAAWFRLVAHNDQRFSVRARQITEDEYRAHLSVLPNQLT